MDKTICGHEREAVKAVLRSIKEYETFGFKNEPTPEQFYQTCSDPAWSVEQTEAIRRAANDTTKLAEILTAEARRLGWYVYDSDPGDSLLLPCLVVKPDEDSSKISIEPFRDWASCLRDGESVDVDIPGSRRLLQRWMMLPDGATDKSVSALMGEL